MTKNKTKPSESLNKSPLQGKEVTLQSKKETKSQKAKSLVMNLRKQPQEKKQQSQEHKGNAIVFTLDDVQETIQHQQKEKAENELAKVKRASGKTSATKSKNEIAEPIKPKVHEAVSLSDILGTAYKKVTTSPVNVNHKVPEKFQKYHELLVQLREKIKAGLEMHEKDAIGVSIKEASGDLSSYSIGDTGTDSFNLDMALSTVSSDREALDEIESAIQRIYEGTYGVCEITGKPIPKSRLLAVPFTRYSLEGQQQLEKSKPKQNALEPTGLNFVDEDDGTLSYTEDDTDE